MPKTGPLGCIPANKELIDVLANTERVIERLSEYDREEKKEYSVPPSYGDRQHGQAETISTGADALYGISFALALAAVASRGKIGKKLRGACRRATVSGS
jgi:hypothetical protein